MARFRDEDFSVVDDTGQAYASNNAPAGRTVSIASNSSDSEDLAFKGALNPAAKQLTLTLAQLSGSPNITVQIPLSH